MKIIPADDKRQAIRLRRTFIAQASGAVHGLLCFIAYWLGAFRESWQFLACILIVALAGHTLMVLFIRSGLNERLKDPGLTIVQITWATAMVMTSVYYLDQLRMVVLMYYVMVVFFGAFALRPGGFVFITAQAVAGYGLVILLLSRYHPEAINLRIELVNWLGFGISIGASSFIATDLSRLRRRVSWQNRDLREALATIQELAVTDDLTGLHNRRHVLEVLEYQKSLADRGNHSFTLAFADLDHFKEINDKYGHQAGDQVLKSFAQIARSTIREVDYVARFGGEEFILVLVQTGLPEAVKVAERLRSRIEKQSFDFRQGDSINVTVSLGITQYEPGENVKAILARADKALYQAKQKGRNRLEAIPAVPRLLDDRDLTLFHTRS